MLKRRFLIFLTVALAGCGGKGTPTHVDAVVGDSLTPSVARVRPGETAQLASGPADTLAPIPQLTTRLRDGQLIVTLRPAPEIDDSLLVLWAEDSSGTLLGAWRPVMAAEGPAAVLPLDAPPGAPVGLPDSATVGRPTLRVIAQPGLVGLRGYARYVRSGLWQTGEPGPR